MGNKDVSVEVKYNPIKEFKNKENYEDIQSEKAFYLTDYILYLAEQDKDRILEEVKRFKAIIERKFTESSEEEVFLKNEIIIYYFYLANIELSTILEKENREKFVNTMMNSFYSILKFKDKKIEEGMTRVFNERFRYYDTFANNPERTYEEKVENHNNIYAKFIIGKFWKISESSQLSLIIKSLAIQSLVRFRLKEYFITN